MTLSWYSIRRDRPRRATWLTMLAIGLIGYTAISAIRAIAQHPVAMTSRAVRPGGHMQAIRSPGTAAMRDPNATPGAGATGTAALPSVPIPGSFTASPANDDTVRPAPSFVSLAASPIDQGRAIECLTAAIYYEAGSEPAAGQRAVAQVILNRVRHPAFPNTVCGVVYQGSERASGCQFSFACDGALARVPSAALWRRAAATAALMLGGYVEPSVGMATHYHTFAVTPAWNRSLVMTAAIGAHFFHRWQGYWGTPAAFTQRYQGGEPMPGPHGKTAPIASAAQAVPAPVASARMPVVATDDQAADPGLTPVTAATDTLPQSPVLDRWKDSGKPLR